MTIPVWPETLPQKLMQMGFAESFGEGALRTQMDAGPDKSRPRFRAAPRPVVGQQWHTATQVETLRQFYTTTLQMGAYIFEWVEPLDDQAEAIMRFVDPPQVSGVAGERYLITLSLEIMP